MVGNWVVVRLGLGVPRVVVVIVVLGVAVVVVL